MTAVKTISTSECVLVSELYNFLITSFINSLIHRGYFVYTYKKLEAEKKMEKYTNYLIA